MKNALVIAGGQWQVPLITELQQKGYSVTVVDPYDDSKGVLIADDHIKADVREKEYILSQIRKKYDVVGTDQSDVSVETVAYLAKELGILGNKIEVVRKFANKYLSRQYAQSIGVPVPVFCEVDSVSQIEPFVKLHGGTFIIKPSDAQSSKGIHLISDVTSCSEIEHYLNDALSYSFTRKAILERFVNGYEITVEGFCSNGKHRVLAMSRKKHFKTGVASALTYPGNIPLSVKERIVDCDNRYVEQSGLLFGPTHAEYIVNEETGEFWLVEIACRGGGTLISSNIVKWVSGFDVQEAYINCLEGKMIDVKSFIPQEQSAELHFFEFGGGIVKSIIGIDEVRNMENVLMLHIPFKEGDTILPCIDDHTRQGFVVVLAKNHKELYTTINTIEELLKIELSDK